MMDINIYIYFGKYSKKSAFVFAKHHTRSYFLFKVLFQKLLVITILNNIIIEIMPIYRYYVLY